MRQCANAARQRLTGAVRHLVFAVALLAAMTGGLLLTVQDTAQAAASERLHVVATTAMIADAARNVGGERVRVEALLGPGVDPHSYRQTRTDVARLLQADVVFWNGLYLEAQMEELLLALAEKKTVVAVGEAVPQDILLADEEYEGRHDPHIWMVPSIWRHAVEAVRDTLSEVDPEGEEIYAANTRRYLAELDALQAYAERVLASVPEPARILITAHDAFNYFGRAFDYDVLGIQGISTESEAGLREIRALVDVIVTRRVPAVFVETSVAERNVRALVEGAAAEGVTTRIGGSLFSDAMGEPGTYEGTYIGMIDHNVTTIAAALGGNVPARGYKGTLTQQEG